MVAQEESARSENRARIAFINSGSGARFTGRAASAIPGFTHRQKQRERPLGEDRSVVFGYSRKLVLSDERRCGPVFLAPGIRIQRLVIPLSNLRRRAGNPIEGRIENVAAALGIPSQPGVRLPA